MGAKAVAACGLIVLGALVVGVLRLTSGRGPSFEITGNGLDHAASNRPAGSSRPGGPETGTTPTGATSPAPVESTPEALRVLRKNAQWLQRRNIALWKKVRTLERENEALRARNKHLTNCIRDACDHDWPLGDCIRVPAIETEVERIDRKEKSVVLAAGRRNKVSRGMRFHISRNGTYVGEVRVTEVLDRRCIAMFVLLKSGMRVRIGDCAATRL